MNEYIVELRNITKRFPGVVAMRNMSIQIKPGEIHGLIGENGAGKSTLIKILTGVYKPDEGDIMINDKKVEMKNTQDAQAAGISCVYQELNAVKMLSITDNIFMGRSIKNKAGLLNYKRMNEKAQSLMRSLGCEIDPQKPCGNFGMGIQQTVEIARAVLEDAKLIIMDEPTSSLGEKEVEQLMAIVRKLKSEGRSILFVSHKLEELFELCDRITVMRDGEFILTDAVANLDNDKLINAMVGRTLDNLFPKYIGTRGEEALRVKNLSSVGVLKDISFKAYRGEILGFAGLVGAGRTELFRAIFGIDPIDAGEIYIEGRLQKVKDPLDAIQKKMAFLTENRKEQGLVLSQTIKTNLILANMKRFQSGPWLDDKKINQAVEHNIKDFNIKTPSAEEVVSKLSGGNQQKVVVGKWVNSDAEIYIFDEPTRGIDVGAKIEVYEVMNRLVKANKCVIMISSELPEILGMSDRVIVMRRGSITGEVERGSHHFNQEDIIRAAWGGSLS
ncbi:MAG: sugar ABC transporter ATP-binding protein [Christensenellales bacterium]|jgi:ribose transport system ATP-binding protein